MAVREGLLLLLAEQPRHGYELKTEFERRTGTLWQLNTGQVYTTLERLQRDGLVEAAAAGEVAPSRDQRRRAYRLTDEGRDAAQVWLDAQTADDTPPRDELVMKVLLSAHGKLDDALRVIDAHRHTLLSRLQAVRRQKRDGDGNGDSDSDAALAARLCDDVLVVRIEADLRWLDMCADRLRAHHATSARGKP
jgi:DNA-binding PadR family transcriptional regulator